VEERRLGPVVGLGTWRTFDRDAELARRLVDAAVSAGCLVVDSSPMYGGAEASLAAGLAGRRDEVDVATKIWADSVEEGRAQLAAQLRWFGRVEIEQIHNLVAWERQLEWLEKEREAGRIGRLGVTHYAESAFGELARALRTRRFETVQLPYNPRNRACERELEPVRAFGVETWPQALLRWALSDERVDLVIPATRRPERVRENAAAGRPPWLGPDERRLVERLAA
jgi:diketogulonate reductase-like aldo/keto reductase